MSEEVVFSVDVSALEADAVFPLIRKDWLDIELALMTGKWFEYRFLNPLAATHLFANEYVKAYKHAFSRNIDSNKAQYVKPLPDNLISIEGIEDKKKIAARKIKISGIWRARQVADAMGMPYDVYLERAFHWALSYWQQQHLPRPQHLYSDLVTDRTAIDWDEYQRTRLCYSTLPQYKTSNYDERVKTLNDHHEHLFSLIASRGNDPEVLAEFFGHDLLPVQKVRARLGDEVCDLALKLAGSSPSQFSYN